MAKEAQHSIVLYQIDNTNICVSVHYHDETFWLSQKAMAELFGCTTDNKYRVPVNPINQKMRNNYYGFLMTVTRKTHM